MSAIETLAALLTRGGERFRRGAFPRRDIKILIACGVVLEDGLVYRGVCEECDDPHEGDVRKTEQGAELLCSRFGWLQISVASVVAARLDIEGLAKRLQRVLGAVGRVRSVGTGGVWSLGVLSLNGDRRCACFIAPSVRSMAEVEAVRTAIGQAPKVGAAAVFCGSLTSSARVMCPEELHLIHLADFARLDSGGGLTVDATALEAVVTPPAPAINRGGAPKKYGDDLDQLVGEMWLPGSPRPMRPLVIDEYRRRHPNSTPPSPTTVTRSLDRVEQGRGGS